MSNSIRRDCDFVWPGEVRRPLLQILPGKSGAFQEVSVGPKPRKFYDRNIT
ncbi:unnamed protein product, partial [marine sediment metagenome]